MEIGWTHSQPTPLTRARGACLWCHHPWQSQHLQTKTIWLWKINWILLDFHHFCLFLLQNSSTEWSRPLASISLSNNFKLSDKSRESTETTRPWPFFTYTWPWRFWIAVRFVHKLQDQNTWAAEPWKTLLSHLPSHKTKRTNPQTRPQHQGSTPDTDKDTGVAGRSTNQRWIWGALMVVWQPNVNSPKTSTQTKKNENCCKFNSLYCTVSQKKV